MKILIILIVVFALICVAAYFCGLLAYFETGSMPHSILIASMIIVPCFFLCMHVYESTREEKELEPQTSKQELRTDTVYHNGRLVVVRNDTVYIDLILK